MVRFKRGGKPFEFPASQGSQLSGKVRKSAFEKVKKKGIAIWEYEVRLETSSQTCIGDPQICIRELGGDACPN